MGIKVLDSVSLREYLVRTGQCSNLPTAGQSCQGQRVAMLQGVVSIIVIGVYYEGKRKGRSGNDHERAPGNRCPFWKTRHVTKNDDIAG